MKITKDVCPSFSLLLDKYGFKDFEEVKAFNNARGVDAYKIVESTQPICFENVKWAYDLGRGHRRSRRA